MLKRLARKTVADESDAPAGRTSLRRSEIPPMAQQQTPYSYTERKRIRKSFGKREIGRAHV